MESSTALEMARASSIAANLLRRKLKLKAKYESGSSYFGFKR
jgi:hypothetical protein